MDDPITFSMAPLLSKIEVSMDSRKKNNVSGQWPHKERSLKTSIFAPRKHGLDVKRSRVVEHAGPAAHDESMAMMDSRPPRRQTPNTSLDSRRVEKYVPVHQPIVCKLDPLVSTF